MNNEEDKVTSKEESRSYVLVYRNKEVYGPFGSEKAAIGWAPGRYGYHAVERESVIVLPLRQSYPISFEDHFDYGEWLYHMEGG